jgi:hypothetical protein
MRCGFFLADFVALADIVGNLVGEGESEERISVRCGPPGLTTAG